MSVDILVLSPHPDDESIGCGGTLRARADEGARITVIYLTSGERGGHGRKKEDTARAREAEALRACELLGIAETQFWRGADGKLRADAGRVARLAGELERIEPGLVFAPYCRDAHADHRAGARLALRAVRAARSQARILMYEVWTPLPDMDVIVDISATVPYKLQAIRAYESQCRVLRFDEAFEGLARYRGEMFAWPKDSESGPGRYAEVFKILPARER